jgi:hypothetical protein
MLLRRLMHHMRNQNWFAVVLDLVIVIVGVFLGFQVTALNDDRKARVEERAALERLQEEAEQVVAYWDVEVRLASQYNANRRRFLEVLAAGSMTEVDRPLVDDAILRLGHYPQFNPPRTVYDELVGGGALGRVSDAAVRRAVAGYAAELDYVTGQLTQFRANLPTIFEAYDGRIYSEYDPSSPSLRRYRYEVERLSADRQFVSDMVDAVRDQLQFQRIREEIYRRAQAMCSAISAAIDTACEPPAISAEDIRARDGVNLPDAS